MLECDYFSFNLKLLNQNFRLDRIESCQRQKSNFDSIFMLQKFICNIFISLKNLQNLG